MSQKLIDMGNLFGFYFIEDGPDDEVDDGKLWNEFEKEKPV